MSGERALSSADNFGNFSEASLDKYVRGHASKEFLVYWEINIKRLQEERRIILSINKPASLRWWLYYGLEMSYSINDFLLADYYV